MKIDKIYVWIPWFLSIVLLFILAQTDLILKESPQKVYQVSLILDSEDESEYVNLKKGVDDAAKRYNIDINILYYFFLLSRFVLLGRLIKFLIR